MKLFKLKKDIVLPVMKGQYVEYFKLFPKELFQLSYIFKPDFLAKTLSLQLCVANSFDTSVYVPIGKEMEIRREGELVMINKREVEEYEVAVRTAMDELNSNPEDSRVRERLEVLLAERVAPVFERDNQFDKIIQFFNNGEVNELGLAWALTFVKLGEESILDYIDL